MTPIREGLIWRGRLRYLQFGTVVLAGVLIGRLGYLQIVQHDKYQAQAAEEHTRKYQIPSTRGEIYAYDGSTVVPLVLNQTMHLLYVDPRYVDDRDGVAAKLAEVTGAKATDYRSRIDKGIEYAILERRVSNDIATKVRELGIKGVGLTPTAYRTYPESSLAAQVLGFVNADGIGQYGIEGFLNEQLAGQPGQLAAKTDTRGIPIATADNIVKPPQNGINYALTIDRNIQAMAEQRLAEQITAVKAKSGSIIIMDTDGAVRAMANFPTFDPNAYSSVTDYSVFMNQTVSSQFEPGSGMKAFAMAIGLDQQKITPDTTYDDTGSVKVADKVINNAEGDKPGVGKSMTVVLRDSLNTGMVFILKMIGGNTDAITSTGKKLVYEYYTKHFGFGERTGIEQAAEAAGSLPSANRDDVTYANMVFGQGLSVTMIQMTTAMAAIANGGTLYQPRLVAGEVKADGSVVPTSAKILRSSVISQKTAQDLGTMLQVVVQRGSGYRAGQMNPGYKIAGKTGTAQIPRPDGKGYIDGANIGSFVGYAPADNPRFVVMVRINEPGVPGFAETTTVPVFGDVCKWLFKYYAIAPTS